MEKWNKCKVSTFQHIQALAVYTPVMLLRSKILSSFDTQLMYDEFRQNNQFVWERISNYKVIQVRSQSFLWLLSRERASSINGARVSCFYYKVVVEAENATFEFRCNLESNKLKYI